MEAYKFILEPNLLLFPSFPPPHTHPSDHMIVQATMLQDDRENRQSTLHMDRAEQQLVSMVPLGQSLPGCTSFSGILDSLTVQRL